MSTLCRTARVLAIVMLICFFGGCRQDELCYLHPHKMPVRVNVDWKRFFPFERPTGMTVMLFSDDENGTVYTELTNTTTHAYLYIPAGTYHALVFNQSITEFGPSLSAIWMCIRRLLSLLRWVVVGTRVVNLIRWRWMLSGWL